MMKSTREMTMAIGYAHGFSFTYTDGVPDKVVYDVIDTEIRHLIKLTNAYWKDIIGPNKTDDEGAVIMPTGMVMGKNQYYLTPLPSLHDKPEATFTLGLLAGKDERPVFALYLCEAFMYKGGKDESYEELSKKYGDVHNFPGRVEALLFTLRVYGYDGAKDIFMTRSYEIKRLKSGVKRAMLTSSEEFKHEDDKMPKGKPIFEGMARIQPGVSISRGGTIMETEIVEKTPTNPADLPAEIERFERERQEYINPDEYRN